MQQPLGLARSPETKQGRERSALPHPFVLLLLGVEKTRAELSQVTAGVERPSLLLQPSGISNY